MKTPGLSDSSYFEYCHEENPTPTYVDAAAAQGGAHSRIQADRPCLEEPGHTMPHRDIDGARWVTDSEGGAWYV